MVGLFGDGDASAAFLLPNWSVYYLLGSRKGSVGSWVYLAMEKIFTETPPDPAYSTVVTVIYVLIWVVIP